MGKLEAENEKAVAAVQAAFEARNEDMNFIPAVLRKKESTAEEVAGFIDEQMVLRAQNRFLLGAGFALLKTKYLEHGEFLKAIKTRWGLAERTVRNWMAATRKAAMLGKDAMLRLTAAQINAYFDECEQSETEPKQLTLVELDKFEKMTADEVRRWARGTVGAMKGMKEEIVKLKDARPQVRSAMEVQSSLADKAKGMMGDILIAKQALNQLRRGIQDEVYPLEAVIEEAIALRHELFESVKGVINAMMNRPEIKKELANEPLNHIDVMRAEARKTS